MLRRHFGSIAACSNFGCPTDPSEVDNYHVRPTFSDLCHQRDQFADLLERILDKGVVVAGDISTVVEVELPTIQLRLVICSVDKARELGLDWWNHDKRSVASGRRATSQRLRQWISGSADRAGVSAGARRGPAQEPAL